MKSKWVQIGALIVVALLVIWRWRSCHGADGTGKARTADDSAESAEGGGSGSGMLARLRQKIAGDGAEFEAVDEQGNPILIPVEGRVVDAVSNEPVGYVDIIFRARGRVGEWTATSEGDGTYSLKLSPGIYDVVAIGTSSYSLTNTKLRLSRGLANARYDIRMVSLARIKGVVVDARGKPIAGAAISFRSTFDRSKFSSATLARYSSAETTAESGEDGSFELDVVPGRVIVEAELGGAIARAVLEGVAPERVQSVRIVLDASVSISGRVIDSRGTGVPGATVHVTMTDELGERTQRQVDAGDGGRFLLENLTPGSFSIEAQAPGQGSSRVARKQLRSGQAASVDLVLDGSAAISGTVLDAKGRPIGGVTVSCYQARSRTPAVEVTSDREGAFSCDNLSTRVHHVRAAAEGYGRVWVHDIQPPATDIEIQLLAPGGVRGLVSDSDGAPIDSFSIRITQYTSLSDSSTHLGSQPPTSFQDAHGKFELPIESPGTYHLVASAPGQAPSDPVAVEVPSGGYADARFIIGAGGQVTGVVRSKSGEPIEQASVKVLSGYSGKSVFTDADGRFRFEGVAQGSRSVKASHADYVATTVSVDVEARTSPAQVVVEMAPAGDDESGLGEYIGIGVVVTHGGDAIRIASLIPRSPASRRLRGGDMIVSIDGRSTKGLSLPEAVEMMRGPKGSEVTLVVKRGDFVFEIVLTRLPVRSQEYPRHMLATIAPPYSPTILATTPDRFSAYVTT